MKHSKQLNELAGLYNQVELLLRTVDMVIDSNIESPEARAFCGGQRMAYENVLKLILDRIKEKE